MVSFLFCNSPLPAAPKIYSLPALLFFLSSANKTVMQPQTNKKTKQSRDFLITCSLSLNCAESHSRPWCSLLHTALESTQRETGTAISRSADLTGPGALLQLFSEAVVLTEPLSRPRSLRYPDSANYSPGHPKFDFTDLSHTQIVSPDSAAARSGWPCWVTTTTVSRAHTLQWLIRCGVALEARRAPPSEDQDYISLKEDLNRCRQGGSALPAHGGDGWRC